MSTLVAVYRGKTVGDAHLIAVSADPALVADVSARLLCTDQEGQPDEVVRSLEAGRRRALRQMLKEALRDR